jgi:hypothetical protein
MLMSSLRLAAITLSLAAGSVATAAGTGWTQNADDVAAVTAANNAFYAAQTALDMPGFPDREDVQWKSIRAC